MSGSTTNSKFEIALTCFTAAREVCSCSFTFPPLKDTLTRTASPCVCVYFKQSIPEFQTRCRGQKQSWCAHVQLKAVNTVLHRHFCLCHCAHLCSHGQAIRITRCVKHRHAALSMISVDTAHKCLQWRLQPPAGYAELAEWLFRHHLCSVAGTCCRLEQGLLCGTGSA